VAARRGSGQTHAVIIRPLTSVDGYVVIDLERAPEASGVVRAAPKLLRDGSTLLARTITYCHAVFGNHTGGASAAVQSTPDERPAAIAAFVAEVAAWDDAPRLHFEPGAGVDVADLAGLGPGAPDPTQADAQNRLVAASATSAAAAFYGDLAGRTAVIQAPDPLAVEVCAALVARGATVVALHGPQGRVEAPGGIAPEAFAEAVRTGAGVDALGTVRDGADALSVDSDVVFVAGKPGSVDHTVAARLRAGALVPLSAVPVTAKALAVARRAGCVVLPDFVTTAGPMLAVAGGARSDSDTDTAAANIDEAVTAVITAATGADDGPLLGACRQAEATLAAWYGELPFGRPLA
jgi:hypothetical protein